MFCGKCGAENKDGTNFCTRCGAPLHSAAAPVKAAPRINCRLVGILAAAVVLGLVLLFAGGRSNKKLAGQVVQIVMSDAASTELEGLFPPQVWDMTAEALGMGPESGSLLLMQVCGGIEEQQEYLYEELDDRLGEGWTYSWELAEDSVVPVEGQVQADYEKVGIKVSAVHYLCADILCENAAGESVQESVRMRTLKIGRHWYLDMQTFADSYRFAV